MLPRVRLDVDHELVHLTWVGSLAKSLPKTLCGESFRREECDDSCVPVAWIVDDAPTCLLCVGKR